MTLHTLIQAAYPDADPLTDYELRDDSDGAGPYLAAWRIAGPLPEGVSMSINSPMQRWSNHCENILKAGGEVMDALSLLERLLIHVLPVIEITEPGAIVQGTRWTKEQCEALLLLAGSVKTFVQTPIEGTNITPAEEISKYA